MIGTLGRILPGYNTRALYKFNSSFNDSSPNGFHLLNSTGVTTIPVGKFEGALRNQGSTGYGARVNACVIANMSQPFSIGGWFYLNALPSATFGLFGCNEGTSSQFQTYLEYRTGGQFRCDNLNVNRSISPNRWYNAWIVRVISPSSLIRIYLDGQKIGEGGLNSHNYSWPNNPPASATKVSCSGPGNTNSNPANGYFDDICFLAYALSDKVIREIFVAGRGY